MAIALSFPLFVCKSYAQMAIGTKGLMNIPSADMYPKKTFVGGANYIGSEIVYYDYPVYDYFVDFTPFSFVEFTFRSTLVKMKFEEPSDKYCEQDRSFTVRLRPLPEKDGEWWPGFVVGWNDFYSNMGRSYYAALYGVFTKHLRVKHLGTFGITMGYSHLTGKGCIYDGTFGGVDFVPSGFDKLRLMAEYDTKGINVGGQVNLFKHWNVLFFTREFKSIGAGFSYQYTIKY